VPSLDVTAFVDEPPTFTIREGLVHICQPLSQQLCVERVMRYSTFLKTISAAQKAVRDYEKRGHAEVVPFKRSGAGH
jgi:hypothetical protein